MPDRRRQRQQRVRHDAGGTQNPVGASNREPEPEKPASGRPPRQASSGVVYAEPKEYESVTIMPDKEVAEPQKYHRPGVLSNWSRYEEISTDDIEEGEDYLLGEDFSQVLEQQATSGGGYLQLKGESNWEENESSILASHGLGVLHIADLVSAINTLPLYTQLNMPEESLPESILEYYTHLAEDNKKLYHPNSKNYNECLDVNQKIIQSLKISDNEPLDLASEEPDNHTTRSAVDVAMSLSKDFDQVPEDVDLAAFIQEPIAERQPSPVKQPSPLRQSSPQKILPPVKQPCIKEPSPVKQPCIKEPSPVKQPCVKEPSPLKQPCVKEPSPVKQPCVKEPSAVKQPCVKEPSPVKQPCVKEPSPIDQPFVREPSPVKQPAIKEPNPVKQPCVKESSLMKQPDIQEPSPVDKPYIKEPSSAKEPAVEKSLPQRRKGRKQAMTEPENKSSTQSKDKGSIQFDFGLPKKSSKITNKPSESDVSKVKTSSTPLDVKDILNVKVDDSSTQDEDNKGPTVDLDAPEEKSKPVLLVSETEAENLEDWLDSMLDD
ncbi:protein piccolo-like isoform X2 [Portunus trituberculatus]|nr:protein piccolo-like isoform X2 [Portunus trituberculatus]XP_045110511.1 protein piccolo-like isoform X2 [Portunus trituberculatus]XP_045110512.1 protein piccolo-like isoform X2 [Portunus trituberculatus]